MRALCATGSPTLYLAHYDMDRSTPRRREAFLDKVKRRLARF